MPNDNKIADELDVMVGVKEAPPDPRFETAEAEPPQEPAPAAPSPVEPQVPAATPPAEPAPPAPEPPPAPGVVPPQPSAPAAAPVAPAPPVSEAPPSPAPTEDPEKVALRAQISALQAQISEIAGKMTEAWPVTPPSTPTPAPAAASPPAAPQSPQLRVFVKDDAEFDQVVTSAASFNAFLNKLVDAVKGELIPEIESGTVERVYTRLPDLTDQMVERRLGFRTLVEGFFVENPDLKPVSKFAGYVMNELAAAEPSLQIPELLKKTGEEVRKRLSIVKQSAGQPSPAPGGATPAPGPGAPMRTGSPAFVTGTGVRTPAVGTALEGLEKEVNDICSLTF